ncbi:MAG: hypothetical protein HOP99_03900, partial [Dermatophilaceae bacterium]|nr:hypothetical protein [Dermatophilaceae bacterium]
MREIDADFAAWARARQLRLLRATALVTGDVKRAEQLVLRALTSLALHWHHVRGSDPDAYVRARLHPAALAVAEKDPHLRDATEPRELPLRLRVLPPRQRAVLVLRCYDGRSVDDTADVVGLSPERVRRAEREGRAALGAETDGGLTPDEVAGVLESATASVREVDLAERAWHDAVLHRSATRRRAGPHS